MFCICRALRFGTRLACVQYSMCHRFAPIICKPNNTLVFRHNRLSHEDASERKELSKLEGKMKLMFTCKKCNTRNTKLISKLAYEKGVIIVRCDGCKNNHLIADNLGWFGDTKIKINIEKLMAMQGKTVRKIMNDTDGYYEAVAKEFITLPKNPDTEATIESNDNCSLKVEKIETPKES